MAERATAWCFCLSAALLATVGLVACAGKGAESAADRAGRRDTRLQREPCTGGTGQDVNRDGRADVFELRQGGRLICRRTDLDFDGIVDQVSFFEVSGAVRRREIDLDGDGAPNVIETYRGGKLVERAIDSKASGHLDLWLFYDPASGALVRREVDGNGDGHVDQYWSLENGQMVVRFDRDDDGQPDSVGEMPLGEPEPAPVPSDADAAVEPERADAATPAPREGP